MRYYQVKCLQRHPGFEIAINFDEYYIFLHGLAGNFRELK